MRSYPWNGLITGAVQMRVDMVIEGGSYLLIEGSLLALI